MTTHAFEDTTAGRVRAIPARSAQTGYARLAAVHAAIYLGAELWPWLSRRSFEAVTGPKVDYWLVRTVGGLITVVGGVMASAVRRPPRRELAVLGAGVAGVLGAISGGYALRGRISKVYLADAALEFGLLAGWLAVLSRGLRDGAA